MRSSFAVGLILALLALTGCSDEPTSAQTSTPAAAPTTSSSAQPTTSAPTTLTPSPTGSGQQVINVTVSGGRIDPPPALIDVPLGSVASIEVTSDVADEVHVHGYDQYLNLVAGQTGRLDLTASIPGRFEVEMHAAGLLLFTVQVQ